MGRKRKVPLSYKVRPWYKGDITTDSEDNDAIPTRPVLQPDLNQTIVSDVPSDPNSTPVSNSPRGFSPGCISTMSHSNSSRSPSPHRSRSRSPSPNGRRQTPQHSYLPRSPINPDPELSRSRSPHRSSSRSNSQSYRSRSPIRQDPDSLNISPESISYRNRDLCSNPDSPRMEGSPHLSGSNSPPRPDPYPESPLSNPDSPRIEGSPHLSGSNSSPRPDPYPESPLSNPDSPRIEAQSSKIRSHGSARAKFRLISTSCATNYSFQSKLAYQFTAPLLHQV